MLQDTNSLEVCGIQVTGCTDTLRPGIAIYRLTVLLAVYNFYPTSARALCFC